MRNTYWFVVPLQAIDKGRVAYNVTQELGEGHGQRLFYQDRVIFSHGH